MSEINNAPFVNHFKSILICLTAVNMVDCGKYVHLQLGWSIAMVEPSGFDGSHGSC